MVSHSDRPDVKVLVRGPASRRMELYATLVFTCATGFASAAGLGSSGILFLIVFLVLGLNAANSKGVGLYFEPETLDIRGSLWTSSLAWEAIDRIVVGVNKGTVLIQWRKRWKIFRLGVAGEPLADPRTVANALEVAVVGSGFQGRVEVGQGRVIGPLSTLRAMTTDVFAMPLRLRWPRPGAWLWVFGFVTCFAATYFLTVLTLS